MKRVFGVLAVIIGVNILGWVAYNLLIERQPAFGDRSPLAPIGVGLVMTFVGVMWILGKPVK